MSAHEREKANVKYTTKYMHFIHFFTLRGDFFTSCEVEPVNQMSPVHYHSKLYWSFFNFRLHNVSLIALCSVRNRNFTY